MYFVANSNLSCERVDISSIANCCAVCVYHFRLICVTATILCRYAAAGGNLHRLWQTADSENSWSMTKQAHTLVLLSAKHPYWVWWNHCSWSVGNFFFDFLLMSVYQSTKLFPTLWMGRHDPWTNFFQFFSELIFCSRGCLGASKPFTDSTWWWRMIRSAVGSVVSFNNVPWLRFVYCNNLSCAFECTSDSGRVA